MQSNRNYWLGMGLTVSSSIFWGIAYPVIKVSLQYYNAFEISFLRSLIAAITLWVFLGLWRRKELFVPRDKKILGLLVVASFLGATVFWTFLNLSVLLLEPDTSSFLVAMYPLIALVLAALFLRDKLNTKRVLGVATGIVGTFIIVWLGEGAGIAGSQPALGIVVALLAALSWAAYMIVTKVLLDRPDSITGRKLSPEYVAFVTFLVAIIPTLLIVFSTSGLTAHFSTQSYGLGLIIFLGILASGVAVLMFNIGMKIVGVSTSAINQLLFPVVAVVSSYFVLGELINAADFFGMALIAVGIIIAQFAK